METHHTPGPWEVRKTGMPSGSIEWSVTANDGDTTVAVMLDRADADLIAAAPALLQALDDMTDRLSAAVVKAEAQGYRPDAEVLALIDNALMAIANAKGRF